MRGGKEVSLPLIFSEEEWNEWTMEGTEKTKQQKNKAKSKRKKKRERGQMRGMDMREEDLDTDERERESKSESENEGVNGRVAVDGLIAKTKKNRDVLMSIQNKCEE